MKAALALCLLLCGPAFASGKPEPVYQDGVLVSFYNVKTGSNCSSSGTVDGKVDDDGKVSGSTSGNTTCSNTESRRYKIKVGDNTFLLRPTPNRSVGGVLSAMALGGRFAQDSVLAGLLPGTPIQVRSDGTGFLVKVGKRESRYDVVAAE